MTTIPLESIFPLYAFCDPARGKKNEVLKRVASRAAIVVGGRDHLSRVFILYAWAKRCPTDQLIEQLYTVADRFKPKAFGIEANGLQALFADALTRDAKWQGRYLPLVQVMQPTNQEKDFRIRTRMQPVVGHGRLFLLDNDPGVAELRAEIIAFPQNPLKDLIDATASMISMMPPATPRRVVDQGREDLLRHLRATGAPPEAIRDAANGRPRWT